MISCDWGHLYAFIHFVIVGAPVAVGKPPNVRHFSKLGVQYTKLAGFGKIICTALLRSREELESYGATHIIDCHGSHEEVVAQIHAIARKDNVTKMYDCYSWTFELALDILSTTKSSRLVILHSHRSDTPAEIKTKKPLTVANYVPYSNADVATHTTRF